MMMPEVKILSKGPSIMIPNDYLTILTSGQISLHILPRGVFPLDVLLKTVQIKNLQHSSGTVANSECPKFFRILKFIIKKSKKTIDHVSHKKNTSYFHEILVV